MYLSPLLTLGFSRGFLNMIGDMPFFLLYSSTTLQELYWCGGKVSAGGREVFCTPVIRSQPLVTCWATTFSSASQGWPLPPSPPLVETGRLKEEMGISLPWGWQNNFLFFVFPWEHASLRSAECSDTFLNGYFSSPPAWSRRGFFSLFNLRTR